MRAAKQSERANLRSHLRISLACEPASVRRHFPKEHLAQRGTFPILPPHLHSFSFFAPTPICLLVPRYLSPTEASPSTTLTMVRLLVPRHSNPPSHTVSPFRVQVACYMSCLQYLAVAVIVTFKGGPQYSNWYANNCAGANSPTTTSQCALRQSARKENGQARTSRQEDLWAAEVADWQDLDQYVPIYHLQTRYRECG
jgi:hypothetical protein